MSAGFQRSAQISPSSSSDCACGPRNKVFHKQAPGEPWLKTTCSGARGKTDCTACRWPPRCSLLMFLIAGVTEMRFASLPPPHTPSPLCWLASWKEFMSVPPKSLTQPDCNDRRDGSNKPCLCDRTGLSHHWLPFCKNSDIWWKEGKSIPGIISNKKPFQKLHHLLHDFSLFIPVTPWMVNEKPHRCNEIWHLSPWILQALYTNGIPQPQCLFYFFGPLVLAQGSCGSFSAGLSRWSTREWGGVLLGLSSCGEFLQCLGSERFSENDWNSHPSWIN